MSLHTIISAEQIPAAGLFKCRVEYGDAIGKIEFMPYAQRIMKSIKLVEDNRLDYKYKYNDRGKLEKLKVDSGADEIIIVRNGLLTDTTYSNVIFSDGLRWVTPLKPLLCGTQRAKLLAEKKVTGEDIRPEDLRRFTAFKLINAMMEMDESREYPVAGYLI